MGQPYTEIAYFPIGRGTNVNASAIPANRVVGFAVSAVYDDAIDVLSVVGASKIKGVTSHVIASGATGDVHEYGVVPVESDGSATIAQGDLLTVDTTTGRVKTVAAGAGVNADSIGRAQTPAAAVAGTIVMVLINRTRPQG